MPESPSSQTVLRAPRRCFPAHRHSRGWRADRGSARQWIPMIFCFFNGGQLGIVDGDRVTAVPAAIVPEAAAPQDRLLALPWSTTSVMTWPRPGRDQPALAARAGAGCLG